MKNLLLIVFFVVNLFALGLNDKYTINSTVNNADVNMPSDHLELVNKIIGELDIPLDANLPNVRQEIYKHIKYALNYSWYSKWRSNITPDDAKFKDDKVRFVDMAVINKKMILNVFFIHYPQANQVYVTRIENYQTSYDNALNEYNKYKAKPEQKEKQNTETSAYLQKDNFMSSTLFLVNKPGGFYQYIDTFVFDTK